MFYQFPFASVFCSWKFLKFFFWKIKKYFEYFDVCCFSSSVKASIKHWDGRILFGNLLFLIKQMTLCSYVPFLRNRSLCPIYLATLINWKQGRQVINWVRKGTTITLGSLSHVSNIFDSVVVRYNWNP